MTPKHRRINHDGGVRRLTWAKTASGYRAWVAAHPDVAAEASTWDETADLIVRAVDEHLQAGEWTADWDPPPPAQAGQPYSVHPDYVVLVPDGVFEILGEPREYFAGDPCPGCRRPRGQRSDAPFRVRVERLAGIMFTWSTHKIVSPHDLYRRSTLDELGAERLAGATPRPVVRDGRSKVELLEVVPPTQAIDPIAVRGMNINGGLCQGCGAPYFSHDLGEGRYITVYPRERVPAGAPAFWVSDHGHTRLCVPAAWWREHRGSPAFRGVISRGLYVAEADAIDTSPVLPIR